MKINRIAAIATISLFGLGAASIVNNPQASNFVSQVITGEAFAQSAPLAKKIQGKPLVVDIYASWCPSCKNIAPTLSQLKRQYAGKVNFVVLDVTDRASTARSEAIARDLGLGQFFANNKTRTGSLIIIDPSTGKILAQHYNNPNLSTYSSVLNAALAKR